MLLYTHGSGRAENTQSAETQHAPKSYRRSEGVRVNPNRESDIENMSEAREALSEAFGGYESAQRGDHQAVEVDNADIDWESFGSVTDLDPANGFKKVTGRKPKGTREVNLHSPLHQAPKPEMVIQEEKSDHRFLVYLFAQGKGVKEVFLQLGGKWSDDGKPLPTKLHGGKYSYAHLTQIRRQEWFQRQVVEVMAAEGEDLVKATFANEFENSVQTIIEIRDDTEEKGSTRLAASNTILDRFLGKPVAHVESTVTTKSIIDMASDRKSLDRELEVLEAEIINLQPEKLKEDK